MCAILAVGSFLFAALAVSAVPARAEGDSGFDFHIGDAFLVSLGFPPSDVTRVSAGAAIGDTITVVGKGQFDVEGLEAGGFGTFVHRNAAGTILASGTWVAKMLLSFDNFGGQAGLPADFVGGHALLRVRVFAHPATNPSLTLKFDATLGVDCAIGNVPTGFEEGITFNAGFINFDEKVSGVTVFVTQDAQE